MKLLGLGYDFIAAAPKRWQGLPAHVRTDIATGRARVLVDGREVGSFPFPQSFGGLTDPVEAAQAFLRGFPDDAADGA